MHNFLSYNLNMPTCYKPIVTITKKMDINEYEENE